MKQDDDQLKIAKLVIYAWIKDWSCFTLYQSITGQSKIDEEILKNLCNKYKFLPFDWFWYHGRPKGIKKYIADLDRKLNNALWDTEDNIKKLEFAFYLSKLNGSKIKSSSKYDKKDIAEHNKASRGFKSFVLGQVEHKEHNQKMNNSHWRTAK